jgi:hypothetical protein
MSENILFDDLSLNSLVDFEGVLSSDVRKALQDDYLKYKNISKVAKKYNISRSKMVGLFKKNNIKYGFSFRKYDCDHRFFSREGEGQFYWAGFLAGNGNISRNTSGKSSYRIFVNMSFREEAFLNKLKNAIKSEAPVKKLTINKNTNPYLTVRFLVSSKEMVTDLEEEFNVTSCKTYNYNMPDWVKDHSLVRHFLRGWVDAKGNFYKDKDTGRVVYFKTSGPVDFLKSFMAVLKKHCGVGERDIKVKRSKNNKELGHIVYTSKSDLRKISDFLYNGASVYLDRKREAAKFED